MKKYILTTTIALVTGISGGLIINDVSTPKTATTELHVTLKEDLKTEVPQYHFFIDDEGDGGFERAYQFNGKDQIERYAQGFGCKKELFINDMCYEDDEKERPFRNMIINELKTKTLDELIQNLK